MPFVLNLENTQVSTFMVSENPLMLPKVAASVYIPFEPLLEHLARSQHHPPPPTMPLLEDQTSTFGFSQGWGLPSLPTGDGPHALIFSFSLNLCYFILFCFSRVSTFFFFLATQSINVQYVVSCQSIVSIVQKFHYLSRIRLNYNLSWKGAQSRISWGKLFCRGRR